LGFLESAVLINSGEVSRLLGIPVPDLVEIDRLAPLGFIDSARSLSYLSSERYLSHLLSCSVLPSALFVVPGLEKKVPREVRVIVVDDPAWCFYSLLNSIALRKCYPESYISLRSSVHSSAVISPVGVHISDGVIVEPRAVIMPGVFLSENVTVRAGAVIGVDGFEHKRTSKGLLSVAHDGEVRVGKGVEIGPNCTVIKGFSYRDTVLGDFTKLDAMVHFAHCAQCGSECLIAANAMIAGSADIGNSVWIGPSSSISSQVKVGDFAKITLGSVVTKDVSAYEHVSGNFAIPHKVFLKHIVSMVRGDS
jgi:UDP-3-O-[3-hydroxymyristoyl] glucosamine N-acyltransferase